MEYLHVRLKAELTRLGLSAAQAARDAGFEDSQGLRDVLAGRKRLSAEMLGVLALRASVDALYVLTGQHAPSVPQTPALAPDEKIMLDNYRHAPDGVKSGVKTTLGAFAPGASEGSKRKAS